ncbi:hypothetical protein [Clostridium cadaveris]|uniref:hypothetical protein n=1 Tax=Clostridium cadaveris TaxID=1529 RepID=UPI00399EEDC9
MGDKYLSEVITADDIKNSKENAICIVSGVGSGKNYFVENVLYEECGKSILYITSRRAKADEILKDTDAVRKIDWNKADSMVTLTNSGVQYLLASRTEQYPVKDMINHFDYFVLDEAHSIATDATFTDAAFHVRSLIEHVIKNYHNKKVILMTGTPEPIEDYLNKKISEKYRWKVIDKRDECISVRPKEIRLISKKQAMGIIKRLTNDKKTIYMANSATAILSDEGIIKDLCKSRNINREDVMYKMSLEKMAELEKNKRKEEVEYNKNMLEKLKCSSRIPEEIKILVTTSSLKEGINIKNEDINIVFCESHFLADIIQFAGRVRKGVDVLYIISDAKQNFRGLDDKRNTLYTYYECKYLKESANQYIEYLKDPNNAMYSGLVGYDNEMLDMYHILQGDCGLHNYVETVRHFVDYMNGKTSAIKYNYITQCFEPDILRNHEIRRLYKEIDILLEDKIKEYCVKNNIRFGSNKQLMRNLMRRYMVECIKGNVKIFEDEKKKIISIIQIAENVSENPKIATVNKILEEYNIKYKFESKTDKKTKKRYWAIEEL